MKKKVQGYKKFKVLFGFTFLLTLGAVHPGLVHAETASDPAPVVQPAAGQANGKKILFDNTHGQTGGAADWVIDGGFSDYAESLAKDGYYVTELRQDRALTLADLTGYDVFVMPEATVPLKVSEQQAITQYVENGGSVFFVGDHYNADRKKNRWDAAEVFNGYRRGAYGDPTKGMSEEEKNSEAMQGVESYDWLGQTFGIRFRYNALDNLSDSTAEIKQNAFGILDNVSGVALHAGSTLAILDPTVAKGLVYLPDNLTSANKWSNAVDEGVYDGGGVNEGAYVAIAKKGQGKAAFIGDSSAVEDASPKYLREENGQKKTTYDGFKEASDATLLDQLTDWLATSESYTSFASQGISLSTKTVLKDSEDPAKSTEPQAEPWAAPTAGYKWWDKSTYAAGAYNSSKAAQPGANASYTVTQANSAIAGSPTVVTVKAQGLKPSSTTTGFSLGVYTPTATADLTVGQQVGFIDPTNTQQFPSTPGYSDSFALTADANGEASKQVLVKVAVAGTFNLRLKQATSNVLTTAYTVAAAETSTSTSSEATSTTTTTSPTSSSTSTTSTSTTDTSSTSSTTSTAPATPSYNLVQEPAYIATTPATIQVQVTGLQPNQTVSDYSLGIYVPQATGQLTTGQQVGYIAATTDFPAQAGYSASFSLTANEKGEATKTLNVRVDESGTFKLRLRQAKKSLLTVDYTVAPAGATSTTSSESQTIPTTTTTASTEESSAESSTSSGTSTATTDSSSTTTTTSSTTTSSSSTPSGHKENWLKKIVQAVKQIWHSFWGSIFGYA